MNKKKIIKNWNQFVKDVRLFFEQVKFLEIRTPTLVPSPGLEPFLDPFETTLVWGSTRRELYLPTSPEFHLKKALCLGYGNIYEIKECFRNGELSPIHQPEFTMLEWYRCTTQRQRMWKDIQDLLLFLKKSHGKRKNVNLKIRKMEDLWLEHCGFKLTPESTLEDLKELCRNLQTTQFAFEDEADFDDLFHLIWMTYIEPGLKKSKNPVVVWHFPPSQAALSKLTADGWADRFELYWQGVELANAFNELCDAGEQRQRFLKDQDKKRKLGKKVVPIDEDLLRLLEKGMPATVGIALGLERLFMIFYDLSDINDLRLFPMVV